MIDPRQLHLVDTPPEWETIPAELIMRLKPDGGIFTPDQKRELDRIAKARWFLIRNETGAKCRGCGAVHVYLTHCCVERPFNGLTEVIGVLRALENNDLAFYGVKFGTIVPISRENADELWFRITVKSGNRF